MGDVLSGCAVRAAIQQEKRSDSDLLTYMEDNCLTVRCIVTKCGLDDSDVGWEVIEHGFGGSERELGRGDNPRDALINSQRKECEWCNGEGVVGNILDTARCNHCNGSGFNSGNT